MFKKFTNLCVALVNRWLPDSFLFAIILTFVVFIASVIFTQQTPLQVLLHWTGRQGFWSLLAFSMQMAAVLVFGNAMAQAPIFKRFLSKIAKSVKTKEQAIMMSAFVGAVACWINWGFGLVIGALLAKEIAKEVKGVDYRLLIASAYSGLLVWHGGIAASIPLTLASGANLAAATGGAVKAAIPTSETIFSTFNLTLSAMLIIALPLINRAMIPDKEHTITIDPKLLIEDAPAPEKARKDMTPAEKMENSKIVWALTLCMGLGYVGYFLYAKGFNLDLNIVNFIFLFVGILLHGNLKRYIDAIGSAARQAGGIILQFPFYAGIMGMMVGVNPATGLSLAGLISNMFVGISTKETFPLWTFLSAGIVNFFVPSGGGQWAVQAPIMMPAGAKLGVSPAITAMAIAWGDAWTNMIQPFWALPALGIAGLGAKDILGYCAIVLIAGGLIICGSFLFLT